VDSIFWHALCALDQRKWGCRENPNGENSIFAPVFRRSVFEAGLHVESESVHADISMDKILLNRSLNAQTDHVTESTIPEIATPSERRYYLGLPAWAYSGWSNRFFQDKPSRLQSYSAVFNTVEGNTSFYAVPDANSIARWQEVVAGTEFRFCFKLPGSVTHEAHPDFDELKLFLNRIEPLDANLGPFLLQFPADRGPKQLGIIDELISVLPADHRYVLEVRHPALFQNEELLEPLIEKYHLGRVMMDSRAIFNGDRTHREVRAALHQKPDVPLLDQVYNDLLFARVLLHPDRVSNADYIEQWAERVAASLLRGHTCYVMIHCPNNQHCPELALQFHNRLRAKLKPSDSIDPLPRWPIPKQYTLI